MKVQASIQGESVRVTGAKRDDLQAAMAMLRKDVHGPAAGIQQFPRLIDAARRQPCRDCTVR